ncbi:dUTP diphosphatase [Desulforhopalus sp. 52FAK]
METKRVQVQFRWLLPADQCDLQLPQYETIGSAGLDIRAAGTEDVMIEPGDIALISTGFAVAIPVGYEIQVRPRSGLAVKYGITLINSPGTIDSDYRGEVKVPLINHGKQRYTVVRGTRIAQMVLAPVARAELMAVDVLDLTDRGTGGFGHTGV